MDTVAGQRGKHPTSAVQRDVPLQVIPVGAIDRENDARRKE
jgi:hypothetical protein